MPKFEISQRRMLEQGAKTVVELEDGVIPVLWIQEEQNAGRDPFEGQWEDRSSSYLSIDVAPVQEESPVEEPEPETDPEPEDEGSDEEPTEDPAAPTQG